MSLFRLRQIHLEKWYNKSVSEFWQYLFSHLKCLFKMSINLCKFYEDYNSVPYLDYVR